MRIDRCVSSLQAVNVNLFCVTHHVPDLFSFRFVSSCPSRDGDELGIGSKRYVLVVVDDKARGPDTNAVEN